MEDLKTIPVSHYQLSVYDAKIKSFINSGKKVLVGNELDNFSAGSKNIFVDINGLPLVYTYVESATVSNTVLTKAFLARSADNANIYVYELVDDTYTYQFTVPSTSDEFIKYNRLLGDTSSLVATKVLTGTSSDDWTSGKYSVFVDATGQPMGFAFLPSFVVGETTYTNVFLARKTDNSAIYFYELRGTTYCYEATVLSTDANYQTYDYALCHVSDVISNLEQKYEKPSSGIPSTDLDESVNSALDKANSALQEHQDISGKADKATTLEGYGITDAATSASVEALDGRVSNAETNANEAKTFCQGVKDSLAESAAGQTDAQVATNTGNISVLLEKVESKEVSYEFSASVYGQIMVSAPVEPTSTESSSLNKVMKIDVTSDMTSVSAYVGQVNASVYAIAFFDANGVFVSGVPSSNGADTYTCDVPSTAKTMYICDRTAILALSETSIVITFVGTVVQEINNVSSKVEQCQNDVETNKTNLTNESARALSAETKLQQNKSGNVFSNFEWLNSALLGLYIDTDAESLMACLTQNGERHWLTIYDSSNTKVAQFLITEGAVVSSVDGSSTKAYAHFGNVDNFVMHNDADIAIDSKVKYLTSSPSIGLYLKTDYDDNNIKKNTFTTSPLFNDVIQELYLDIAEEYKTDDLQIKCVASAGRGYNWISIFSGDTLIVQFAYIAGAVQVSSYGSRSYALFNRVDDSLLNKSGVVSTKAFEIANSPAIASYVGQAGNTISVVNNYNKLLFNNMMIYGTWQNYSLKDFAGVDNIVSCDLLGFMFTDFPVGISLCTKAFNDIEYQVASFYNINHRMCVALRSKASGVWSAFTFYEFDTYVGWDSHNYVVAVFDADGYIHVSGNMHSNRLIYYKSTSVLSVSSFDKKTMVNDDNEIRVTYPCFIPTNDNRFLFLFRNGYSGNGDTFINEYKDGTWSRLCQLIDGTTSVDSAYFIGGLNSGSWGGYYNSSTGYYEITYMFRAQGDASTCHDIFYIKTKDFISYYNRSNTLLSLPLDVNSDCKVVSLSTGNGLSNAICAKLITSYGYLIAYHRYDDSDNSQIYATLITEGEVTTTQVTSWTGKYDMSGTGTLASPIAITDIAQSTYNDADCFMIRASFNGVANRFILSTSLELIATDTSAIPSSAPSVSALQTLENTAKLNGSNLVSVSITRDLMMPEKYVIRKESMAANNDVARTVKSALPTSVKIAELS